MSLSVGRNSILNFPAKIWRGMCRALLAYKGFTLYCWGAGASKNGGEVANFCEFCRISKVIEMPTILQCFKCWKWISWIWTKIFFMVKDKIRVDFSFCYRCKISQTMLPLNLDCRIKLKQRRHALVEGNLYHDSLSALLKWYISLYFLSCKIPTS